MGVVPIVFRGQGNITASYDFIDAMTGCGYILLYGGKGTSGTNGLTNTQFRSSTLYTGGTGIGADAMQVDINFDLVISKPMTVKGTAWIKAPYAAYSHDPASTATAYIIAKIYKVVGGVETLLGTATQSASVNDTCGGVHDGLATFAMTGMDIVLAETHFTIGMTLRLTMEGWIATTAGHHGEVWVAHDPAGTVETAGAYKWSSSAYPPTLQLSLPIKIDI